MERPFSMPPRPSGAPNSLIFDAVNRYRNLSTQRCEGRDGSQPPGIVQGRQRPGGSRSAPLLARRGSRCRGPARAWPIKSLRLSTWRPNSVGAAALGVERLFTVGLLLLALLDQSGHAVAVLVDRGDFAPSAASRSSAISLRMLDKLGEVAGQRLGLLPHLRQHCAEQDRGAHGLQRVFRRLPSAPAADGGRCVARRPARRR